MPQSDTSLNPPQPLILDPKLRTPPTARIIGEWAQHGAKGLVGPQRVMQPWILCGNEADEGRAKALEEAGARVVRVDLDENGESGLCARLLPAPTACARLLLRSTASALDCLCIDCSPVPTARGPTARPLAALTSLAHSLTLPQATSHPPPSPISSPPSALAPS